MNHNVMCRIVNTVFLTEGGETLKLQSTVGFNLEDVLKGPAVLAIFGERLIQSKSQRGPPAVLVTQVQLGDGGSQVFLGVFLLES